MTRSAGVANVLETITATPAIPAIGNAMSDMISSDDTHARRT